MDILDTIDGTLADYGTSRDAMRWVPEEKREARPPSLGSQISLDGINWLPVSFDRTPLLPAITVDTSQFEVTMRQVGEALAEFLRPVGEMVNSFVKFLTPVAEAVNEVRDERVSAMHREYRRRSNARRRRR